MDLKIGLFSSTDRHHCIKSVNIPKNLGWPDSPLPYDSLMMSMKFD